MKLILLTIASAKEEWASTAKELYLKKINPIMAIEAISLKPKKLDRDSADLKRANDSNRILEEIASTDFVILFDENGKEWNSVEWSKKLQTSFNSGKKRAVFVIGGAFGASSELKQRADLSVSLSKMTFNHLVAEVVALEQIYRGLTILKNLPYHNA